MNEEDFIQHADPSLTLKHITPWHTAYFQALLKLGVPLVRAVHMTNKKPEIVPGEPVKTAFADIKGETE